MDTKLMLAILTAREAGEHVLLQGKNNYDYAAAVKTSLEKSGFSIVENNTQKTKNKVGFHEG